MNDFDLPIEMLLVLQIVTAMCALVLAGEFVRIIRIRRPLYPYMGYATASMLALIAVHRFAQAFYVELGTPLAKPTVAEVLTDAVLILCTVLIPRVRRKAYHRDRFNLLQESNLSLHRSLRFFESFMNNVPAMAFVRDSKGRMRYANKLFYDVFGACNFEDSLPRAQFTPDEIALQAFPTSVAPLDDHGLRGMGVSAEEHIQSWWVNRFSVMGVDSEPMIATIAIDISEQLKTTHSVSVLASIIELAPDAVYSCDETGQVLTWNAAAERLFGYSIAEMRSASIETILSSGLMESLNDLIKGLPEEGSTINNFETQCRTKGGDLKEIVVSVVRLSYPSSGLKHYAFIARDVTNRISAERQLSALNRELRSGLDALSKTNASLRVATDRAISSSTSKSAFVANISHELRTPISGIIGMSELLLLCSLDADIHRMLLMLYESAQSLLKVVNGILDFSKLESGKTTVEMAVLKPRCIVVECAQLFAPASASKNLELKFDIDSQVPEIVRGDPQRVNQVLNHLMENAVRLTQFGFVQLSLCVKHRHDDYVVLEFAVSDSGPGVSPEDRRVLFTPFPSARIPSSGGSGSGLGLYVSKRYVELMGGLMGYEDISESGGGSRFWFTLPFLYEGDDSKSHGCGDGEDASEVVSPAQLACRRVLSVEDSPVLARLIMRQLSIIGVSAETVATGHEAIKLASLFEYDVILMDVHLTDMTGHDVTAAIRQRERDLGLPAVPIIALTAGNTCGDREVSIECGMNDYLVKPVSIDGLRTAILKWLKPKVD